MNTPITPFDLNIGAKKSKNITKEQRIQYGKKLKDIIKESRNRAKLTNCYYCGKSCDGFCNSHTLPQFCLRNVAENGKIKYINSIVDLAVLDTEQGVKQAGTFQIICRECDQTIFQAYENPEKYDVVPSMKMLAEIDMKCNLKKISNKLQEKELYDLMLNNHNANGQHIAEEQMVIALDLEEYKKTFLHAKKTDLKPFFEEYYIGFHSILPYRVPIAIQSTVSLIVDLEGNIINEVYNKDPQYIIKYVTICVFPLRDKSVVFMFVDKNNRRYSRFFRQLKKSGDLEEQLKIINYIIFAYTEDFYISPKVKEDVLKKLNSVSGKTSKLYITADTSIDMIYEKIKQEYDFDERFRIPNLLSEEYSLDISD